MEQYTQITGVTAKMLLEQMKPQALRRIQSRLVLEAVVKAENIQASEEDFEKEVQAMAEAYGMEADKVKEMLGENGREQVMQDLCVKKALALVTENAEEKEPEAE
ncbi:MAG: trigger factor, partial [Acetatifactor sp.]|nr:trigger factor [Acetatifactor sp.]